MPNFIALNSTRPEAVARYKREVRAIVVDRAAEHLEQLLPADRKPSTNRYEKALEEALRRAKLDVMAELFRLMHDLARASVVARWSRRADGLRRERRDTAATMQLLTAYDQVVRYVASMRANVKPVERKRR